MENCIHLHGYLGRDPELEYREGRNGKYAHVSFSLAVSRDYSDDTDWFFCVMNGKRAEVIDKWFRKGSQMTLRGRMESYKPKDNPDVTKWLVVVENFDFCDSKDSPRGSANKAAQGEPKQTSIADQMNDLPDSFEEAEDDIPF